MLNLFVITGLLVLGIIYIIYHIYTENGIKRILTSEQIIPLQTVMTFSNLELIKRLKRYYKGSKKIVFIEYSKGKHLVIFTDCSQKYLLEKLEQKQRYMINNRYELESNAELTDTVDSIIYDLWLDYAYKVNYENLFWREINDSYEAGKMSNSSYNEIYRRFYKYKYGR